MHWLGSSGYMIDYEQQLVTVRTPSGGELVIHGKGYLHGPALCSAARAWRYLQEGCSGFLAYVSDTQIRGTMMLIKCSHYSRFSQCVP